LKEWQKTEIKIENNFAENAKLTFSRGRLNGKKEGYWAVDNIAFCRSSIGNKFSFNLFHFFFYIILLLIDHHQYQYMFQKLISYNIKVPLNISYNSVCKVLDTNLTDTTICEKIGYIGKYCNISCSQVLGKSYPNCETYQTRLENSNCSCAWGYEGEFCNESLFMFKKKWKIFMFNNNS
jgi:hypothetical protein